MRALAVALFVGVALGATEQTFVPLTDCTSGKITYYTTWANGGSCGFKDPLGETGPGYTFGAAPNEAFYDGALHCGECVEIVGPEGAVRVMVTDMCPASDGPCNGDHIHFDLTEPAFPLVMDKTLGGGNVTWRFVECDVEGPIKMKMKPDSSLWWISMLVFNHRLGLRAVEFSQDGGATWIETVRESWNHWTWRPPSGQSTFTFPMQLRFRSTKGEYVQAVINSIDEKDQVLLGQGQFSTTGGGSSFEECCTPPDVFTDVYTDALRGIWADWSYSTTTTLEYSGITPHTGNACIRAVMQGWGGLQIGSNLAAPRSQYSAVSMWIRTEAAASNRFLLRVGSGFTDVTVGTSAGGTWEHVQASLLDDCGIPMTAEDAITRVVLKNNAATAITVYIDDIQLVRSTSAPSLAVCADSGASPRGRGSTGIAATIGSALCSILFAALLQLFV